MPHLGFIFFVWVGIFSLTTIAHFWSYANEIYTRPEGDRLFPLVAIGSTAGECEKYLYITYLPACLHKEDWRDFWRAP